MSQATSIVLVGIGGYGRTNLNSLRALPDQDSYRIVGVVDPYAQEAPSYEDIRALGVPVCDTLADFYARHQADLAIISTPISLHCPQICAALEHGAHVLCEKPLGATIQEARAILAARDQARRTVEIGYQWSFSPAVQSLKADILAGKLGPALQAKTLVCWPRNHAYFARNHWAGRLRDDEGRWVLDSPVNNAVSHYLHNMLYLLGERRDRAAQIHSVQAELYRANAIENFDTAGLRVHTAGGVEVLFLATHACRDTIGPITEITFERATVTFGIGEQPNHLLATWLDGTTRDYGDPLDPVTCKVAHAIQVAAAGAAALCPPEAAMAQTLAVNGMHESCPQVRTLTKPRAQTVADGRADVPADVLITCIADIEADFQRCFAAGQLPSEANIPWAQPGEVVDLADYTDFPRGPEPS